MIWIIIAVISILLFGIAIVSPHTAGKIQYKTDQKSGWLKRMSNWFWSPIAWWLKSGIETIRKIVNKVAQWGKRTRSKLPF